MTDQELKALISQTDSSESIEDHDTIPVDSLSASIITVMAAYQNANKWLDSIKEDLLINKGTVFFSNYVHELAHTMPVRFDKFGDILHTQNILVPYPATPEIFYPLSDCNEVFSAIFQIIQSISTALILFIKAAQDTDYHSMACKAEELLIDIDAENENIYRMQKVYDQSQDLVKFDKWVKQFLN